jgi:hypothetical protein
MYIIKGKSATGPNPTRLSFNTSDLTSGTPAENAAEEAEANAANQYQFQLERASLVSAPVPRSRGLDDLTETGEEQLLHIQDRRLDNIGRHIGSRNAT